ncbi:MAG TPA: HlyD family type I secretion periplasmic adaptor subunit [Stenotrophomonas sp.]|nr:HlyD family type I secretion periplasmic adaptor subunit [Stenotrophomonas sp.]
MRALPVLLQRVVEVGREGWRRRREMDAPERLPHELEFLPAVEALRDTPSHPAPRVVLGLILLVAVLAVLWGWFGRIDVVSVAQGKVLASGRSKPIQSDSLAVVKAILVEDGTHVAAGQLLVELDPSLTDAELQKLQDQLLAAHLDRARADALLAALQAGGPPRLADLAGVPADAMAQLRARVAVQYQELQSRLAQTGSAQAQRESEIGASQAAIAGLRQTLPISEQMAADYRQLQAGKFVAKHAWLEREQAVVRQRQQLAAEQARLAQAQAARQQAVELRANVAAEASRGLIELQQDANQRLSTLTQELRKARQRDRQTRLLAPVAGTVQQLAVSAPGAVVMPAQPLLVIVPDDQPMEIEATLANRDVGAVHTGQSVQVKVDAFDFTRYGMLQGKVASVSSDAIQDPQRGPVYSVRVRLDSNVIRANGREFPLVPGMSVRTEVQTGRRRLISYFLSPLQRRVNESLIER